MYVDEVTLDAEFDDEEDRSFLIEHLESKGYRTVCDGSFLKVTVKQNADVELTDLFQELADWCYN